MCSKWLVNYIVVFITIHLVISSEVELKDGDTNDEDMATELTPSEQIQESTFQLPDEAWIIGALHDIAYYLRSYKFNEWDRRYNTKKPDDKQMGYIRSFPTPPLRSIHWKVFENCDTNFYKCITYLHKVIEKDPISRHDDPVTVFNEKQITMTNESLSNLNTECKKARTNSENSGLPFDSPIEKFQWRTSAAYYMCWYTFLETPALSMLGEACDNFANCYDEKYGFNNKDPRADDKMPFACASYSFCPDICCPNKYIDSYDKCYDNVENPCFAENSYSNSDPSNKVCQLYRNQNQNFMDMISNKWNVTCNCKDKGFGFKSQFGMCVDLNECVTGENNCDQTTETCLNLPGTYKCICKWGYEYHKETNQCVQNNIFKKPTLLEQESKVNLLLYYIQCVFTFILSS